MRSRTKNIWKLVGVAAALGTLGIQAWPIDRSNPEGTGDIFQILHAPPAVTAAIRRCCYDCHSNETQWPWYSYIAPVSWWVADHVHEGRGELNFSNWADYSDRAGAHKLREAWEEIEAGKMPLDDYLRAHGDAVLSDAEKTAIQAWIAAVAPRTGGTPGGDDDDAKHDGTQDGDAKRDADTPDPNRKDD